MEFTGGSSLLLRRSAPTPRRRYCASCCPCGAGVFGDIPAGPICRLAATRYEENRLRAMELLGAELTVGRHEDIPVGLTGAHLDNPWRERFCQQLMLALYRAGRQADVLEVRRSMRRRLSEEPGVQPSWALRDLEHAILSQDAALTAARGSPHGAPAERRPGGRKVFRPAERRFRRAGGPACAV